MIMCKILFLLLLGIYGTESTSPPTEKITKSQPKSLQKASPRISTIEDYETGDSIPSIQFQSMPSFSVNHWLNDIAKPQSLGTGWYGFNQFIQRSARNLPLNTNYRLQTASLLGEGTQLFPTVNYFPNSPFNLDQNLGFHQPMNDLQSIGTYPHHDQFQPNNFHKMEQPKFPRRVMVPVLRPQPQRPNFERHQQPFNYRRQASENIHRSAASPTPVTIKIVPLKLSSIDLANALKSMSWLPIPIDMLKLNNNQNSEGNQENEKVYSDKRQSMFDEEDESDLPPPSSHVATPPLGITYAEGRRSERYVNRLQPRK
ncbi:uncharacterized protein TNCT_1271 [Trichonephila clavata]|uniref:Uncharacterized protein n=1 Tax=Trichonephila clavata TaxID=2740835 RepID=A0A8X6H2C2_TRICU|nr:uncharacterized protein TNCT_1271 [Trichonephila clavata]